ncbi:MAG: hypothetical protein RBS38_14585 [Bacteroidales bacterium]|jgi:hypothetical protein|nr:hypothetical protein [Bacteroidales bacterium]
MFAKALEKASGFIRPVHAITRYYRENMVKPAAYNIFFVNEHGVASQPGMSRKYWSSWQGAVGSQSRREGVNEGVILLFMSLGRYFCSGFKNPEPFKFSPIYKYSFYGRPKRRLQ